MKTPSVSYADLLLLYNKNANDITFVLLYIVHFHLNSWKTFMDWNRQAC